MAEVKQAHKKVSNGQLFVSQRCLIFLDIDNEVRRSLPLFIENSVRDVFVFPFIDNTYKRLFYRSTLLTKIE